MITKADFVEYCHLIQSKNLVAGSGGNISTFIESEVWMTPHGRSLESLKPDDIVVMSLDGTVLSEGHPTTEYRMHIGCYRKRPDIHTVVHVHSIYTTAVSCLKNINYDKAMPIYTPGYGKRIAELPVLPYMRPGSEELAAAVCEIIEKRNSVMLENHGLITVGSSFESALNLAEEIEENAQITLLLGSRGKELNAEQIRDLINY